MSQCITYSPAYTLVPTYECFNHCSYCNFRVQPGGDDWLQLAQARSQLDRLDAIEILILSGEVHPDSPRRRSWIERIYALCQLAIDQGFLPHTNAGPLGFEEMTRLKRVNVSMGLMLEQLTPRLLDTVHRHAPSKRPEIRLQQLLWASLVFLENFGDFSKTIGRTTLKISQSWSLHQAPPTHMHVYKQIHVLLMLFGFL